MTARRTTIGLALLAALTSIAALMPQPPSQGAAHRGKLIAAPRFEVPEHMLAPPRPAGSATVTLAITGKLAMRGCFTSASTNGRKVKCPGAVRKACVEGRTIEVYASHAQTQRQFVTAAADGSFTATVVFEDDYLEGHLLIGPRRAQSKGLRIVCYPLSSPFDVSEARP